MNMQKIHSYHGSTIEETLSRAHHGIDGDLVGLWGIVSCGRVGFELSGGDLREFVFLYILSLTSHGAVTIGSAGDGVHCWRRIDRFGAKPEEVAGKVTEEWIDQGEPDPPAYEALAFALPSYLESPENRRDWPLPDLSFLDDASS
jgi:hypothetical protein